MDLYRFIQRNYKIVCEKTREICVIDGYLMMLRNYC